MTDETPPPTRHPLRWAVIGLIFCATLVSYIDRQTVSVMAPVLCKDLSMTNTQYGAVGSCFLFAYALSMWLWGGVFDKVGSRLGYTLAISIWSVAEIAHSAVAGILSLGFLRGLLGIGEAGNWPGATRTIAVWFSNKERALGMGIANAGASFGPALAAPLIIGLQLSVGWRATFVLTGLLGILWLWAWISIYPKSMEFESGRPMTSNLNDKGNHSTLIPWPILFRRKEVWAIILARFFGDPIWWLYLNWLPKYLSDVRHFSMKQIGASAWAPFLAAGVALRPTHLVGVERQSLAQDGDPFCDITSPGRSRRSLCRFTDHGSGLHRGDSLCFPVLGEQRPDPRERSPSSRRRRIDCRICGNCSRARCHDLHLHHGMGG